MPRAIGIGIGTAFGGGVGEAPFSPLDLSPALWLDASDTSTITESSGAVSQWNDKSGNGRNLTQGTAASQPLTGANTQNGLNVLYFDGGDTLFRSSVSGLPSAEASLFIVVSHAGAPGGIVQLRSSTSGTPIFTLEGDGGATYGRRRNDANSIGTTATNNSTGYQYATVRFNGSSVEYRRNGTLVGSVNNSGTATYDHVRLGANPWAGSPPNFNTITNYHVGNIAEVILTSSSSTAERDLVETYLADKWGL